MICHLPAFYGSLVLFLASTGVPVAIIGPDISVTVGDQATISCSVTGYPLSTAISWLKIANGVRTNVDVSQARFSGGTVSVPSLTITSVESSDEGDYQCSATNILGTSQSGTAYLDVLGSKWNAPLVTIICYGTLTFLHSSFDIEFISMYLEYENFHHGTCTIKAHIFLPRLS